MLPRLLLLAFLSILLDTRACGPHFPNAYLMWGNYQLPVPQHSFYREMTKQYPPATSAEDVYAFAHAGWEHTLRADLRDLRVSLVQSGHQPSSVSDLLSRYRELREAMHAHADGVASQVALPGTVLLDRFDLDPYADLLSNLPAEFRLYIRGAADYRAGYTLTAVKHWQALLDLPADQRRYRTTWAFFMLGKAEARQANYHQALQHFTAARQASADGFADSLRLAPSSLGWLARMQLEVGDERAAIASYLELLKTGNPDERYVATTSLYLLCEKHKQGEWDATNVFLTSHDAQQVMAVWLGSRYYRGTSQYLEALKQAGAQAPVAGAAMLAQRDYEVANFRQAREWLALAGDGDYRADWIRGRLALRDGDLDTAEKLLQQARVREVALPDSLQGDLGIILMAKGQFLDAFETFMAFSWPDAAYLSERVLTLDELADYLDRNRDRVEAEQTEIEPGNHWLGPKASYALASDVLARRLVRAGDYARARRYLHPQLHEHLDRLTGALALAHDKHQTIWVRALNLMKAARLYHSHGMELAGTELAPDYTIWGGSFDWPEDVGNRLKLPMTQDEHRRLAQTEPTIDKRFHYRYVAAEWMWEAAQLLPDHHLLTAQALYEGGMFIQKSDPQTADRFYKALVNRCHRLPIGQRADEKRWFPESFAAADAE